MTGALITTPAAAKAFILAGKAVFTAKSLNTGNHMTFKVKAAKKAGPVSHFVSVRDGSPGDTAFPYLGTIHDGKFKVGRREKTRYTESSIQSVAFKWILANLALDRMPPSTEIWHEGRCGRCSRVLTHPDSIASGIGPECARKADQ